MQLSLEDRRYHCCQGDMSRRLSRIFPLMLRITAFGSTLGVDSVLGKAYSGSYTFMANRNECDGQCTYCQHAHHQFRWSDIRTKITRYVNRPPPADSDSVPPDVAVAIASEARDVQTFIDWSWSEGTHFECIIGIISLRLLSYGYSDPFQFNEGNFNVLDWLDTFNSHTGALDLLTSSWAAVLGGGWPVFKQLLLVSRKLRDRLADDGRLFPALVERDNECDILDGPAEASYRKQLRSVSARKEHALSGTHLLSLAQNHGCPVGRACALLSLALDLVRNQGMYQGSLKDPHNFVYTVIVTAQDLISNWISSKPNWSPFWDLLTTEWPLWELLGELSCHNSDVECSTRSALQCFDLERRAVVQCPHGRPRVQRTFAGCGEHDVCSLPQEIDPREWCVPFGRRPEAPRRPFLLQLSHDIEERLCSQCGQDGVLRTLFEHVGFRDAAGAHGRAPFFVEFGARKPGMLNSAMLRQYCLWDGILMDSQPGETPHGGCKGCPGVADIVRTEFVTAENVNDLFRKHGVPVDFDLLTIDTDYNDYWIWRSLLENGTFRPRIVAVDFNPDIPLSEAKTVRYEPFAEWDGTKYTVASLLAYALLARAHGYSFAYALEMGSHAFFVRSDLLAESDRNAPLRSVKKSSHMTDLQRREFADVLYDFLPPRHVGEGARGVERGPAVGDGELAALRGEVRALSREAQSLRALLAGERRGGSASAEALGQGHADTSVPTKHLLQRLPAKEAGAARFYEDVRLRMEL